MDRGSFKRRLKAAMMNTEDEQRAAMTGLNLFFGAMLGANLGSLGSLDLREYVSMAAMLSGVVACLFLVLASRRRAMVLSSIAAIGFVLTMILIDPSHYPAALETEVRRIVATLLIWLVVAGAARMMPVLEEAEPRPAKSVLAEEG